MKPHGPLCAGVVLLLGLCFASTASAQLPWRLFGPKNPDKTPAPKSPLPDPRRMAEINVEVAWLGDPVTFPYYLEARINSAQQLEVRGYVPNKNVREHALRTAQVYSSLPVIDAMKEHASLLVRPSQMSPQQLQNSVLSSLKVALPKQYQQLKIDCSGDGKVYVFGPVNSYEEKVAVSHSLRRLHGCTSVQNMTSVPAELTPHPNSQVARPQPGPKGEAKGPILVDLPQQPNPAQGPMLIPPSSLAKDGPGLGTKVSAEVIKVELPTPAVKPAIEAPELQKRIKLICPKATAVTVTFTSATEVRVLINAKSSDDINPIADRILAMPELQNFRSDLQFKIGSP